VIRFAKAAAIAVVLLLGAVAGAVFLLERVPIQPIWFFYDDERPDARIVRTALAAAGKRAREVPVDLSAVNGGEWKVACLVGGYERPVSVTHQFARQHRIYTRRLSRLSAWLWITEVPEPDLALTYITSDDVLRVFRLRGRFYEHVRVCTVRAKPLVLLADS
jgi:hypothetical protein